MKANISIERTVLKPYKYYLVINDTFVIKINKRTFHELAEFLKITID